MTNKYLDYETLITNSIFILRAIGKRSNAITIMDKSFSYTETLDANSMRQRITAHYTGEISYDGSNRRLVLNNSVALQRQQCCRKR